MLNVLESIRRRFRYDDREMPFLDHLEEFRKMIIRSAIAIVVGMAVCAYFVPWMTEMLRAPGQAYIESGRVKLQFQELSAGFMMWFTMAFWSGIVVSMPALMVIVGSFVLPGLKDSERIVIQRVGFFSGLLFVVGVVVGYVVTLPVAIDLLLGVNERFGDVDNILLYQEYIDFTLHVLLGFGVAFQLPVVIIILGKLGFLTSRQLREKRRHVIVGLFILAMLLTPPDVMTQVQMAIPLILLYEFCIWFLYFTEGGRIDRRKRDKGNAPDSETAVEQIGDEPKE